MRSSGAGSTVLIDDDLADRVPGGQRDVHSVFAKPHRAPPRIALVVSSIAAIARRDDCARMKRNGRAVMAADRARRRYVTPIAHAASSITLDVEWVKEAGIASYRPHPRLVHDHDGAGARRQQRFDVGASGLCCGIDLCEQPALPPT